MYGFNSAEELYSSCLPLLVWAILLPNYECERPLLSTIYLKGDRLFLNYYTILIIIIINYFDRF